MRRLLLRALALLATILAAVALAAVPARAHGELVDGSPGPGDDVAVGTTVLRLEFTALDTGGAPLVAMRGPSGDLLPVGQATYGDEGTVCALASPLEAGVHELTYSVISDDGDRQTGTYSFEVSEAGSPSEPGTCASPTLEEPGPEDARTIEQKSSGTLPAGVLYGLGGLAVLVGGLVVLRIRSDRRRHPAA
ncbi:copper resistance protein CopC [Nocardioides sp.]|uniref:copper resistance CopC family protein n=1 Tax=Nocardioides sp. TaxID=35761 RepID=UPI002639159C|nr:copper resistance protein CopC [Nocardioides sp.]